MTMKFLEARQVGAGYRFRIHLDTTKLDGDGNPDPLWVYEANWGPGAGQTEARLVAEVKALAAAELARRVRAAGTGLSSEGTTF